MLTSQSMETSGFGSVTLRLMYPLTRLCRCAVLVCRHRVPSCLAVHTAVSCPTRQMVFVSLRPYRPLPFGCGHGRLVNQIGRAASVCWDARGLQSSFLLPVAGCTSFGRLRAKCGTCRPVEVGQDGHNRHRWIQAPSHSDKTFWMSNTRRRNGTYRNWHQHEHLFNIIITTNHALIPWYRQSGSTTSMTTTKVYGYITRGPICSIMQ